MLEQNRENSQSIEGFWMEVYRNCKDGKFPEHGCYGFPRGDFNLLCKDFCIMYRVPTAPRSNCRIGAIKFNRSKMLELATANLKLLGYDMVDK